MSGERLALARRGRRLAYFTIAWNSIEGLIAIGAGAAAGSISLVGFGVDSVIEVTSGAALLWRITPMKSPLSNGWRVSKKNSNCCCCATALAVEGRRLAQRAVLSQTVRITKKHRAVSPFAAV